MLERAEKYLNWIAAALLLAIAAKVAFILKQGDPLGRVRIPPIPTLATNSASSASATGSSNSPIAASKAASTNQPALTNGAVVVGMATNTPAASTNASSQLQSLNPAGSNQSAGLTGQSTNIQLAGVPGATNVMRAGTNIAAAATIPPRGPVAGPTSVIGGPPGQSARITNSPLIQARIERIVQSELLAPVQRPLPMALIGLAGESALIRTPSGQTGFIKEGAEMAGVKVLRVGTNRVLIEHDGEKKELTIFSGFGSESLLPKPIDNGPK